MLSHCSPAALSPWRPCCGASASLPSPLFSALALASPWGLSRRPGGADAPMPSPGLQGVHQGLPGGLKRSQGRGDTRATTLRRAAASWPWGTLCPSDTLPGSGDSASPGSLPSLWWLLLRLAGRFLRRGVSRFLRAPPWALGPLSGGPTPAPSHAPSSSRPHPSSSPDAPRLLRLRGTSDPGSTAAFISTSYQAASGKWLSSVSHLYNGYMGTRPKVIVRSKIAQCLVYE